MAILTLNAGSSSIKFALFGGEQNDARLLHGAVSRVGTGGAKLAAFNEGGGVLCDEPVKAENAADAGGQVIAWLKSRFLGTGGNGVAGSEEDGVAMGVPIATGHRIVHGGTRSLGHQRITAALLAEMDKAAPLDRAHMPAQIGLIRQCQQQFEGLPQFACFDTVFHAGLPRIATMLPLPRKYFDAGVRKYGFHGLSYEFLMAELLRVGDAGEAQGRVLLAHLGAGASLAAVAKGVPVDTTMAFTPTSGLMMATRPGDLDPGVMVYLAREGGLDAAGMDRMMNTECGLLGVSETSGDIRDLLGRRATDERAAEAVALFCRSVVKNIGAMAAAMGGIDTLIFAGGVGENAAEIRAEICKDLAFLGVGIDAGRNERGCGVISHIECGEATKVVVRIVRTDEEAMIARHVVRMMGTGMSGA